MTARVLWSLPVPSTALLDGTSLEDRPGRELGIHFDYEGDDDNATLHGSLLFKGVEAFRLTYYTARTSETLEAYDRLVDWSDSDWLESVRKEVGRHGGRPDDLRHLMIFFDDGPCYEAICRSFTVDERDTTR